MAASILLSGLYVTRFIEVMSIANILRFTHRTYNQIQSELLFPSVNTNYNKHSPEWLDSARNQDRLELVGDGRCDSPGFIETYGTYTLMDAKNNLLMLPMLPMSPMLEVHKSWKNMGWNYC